MNCISIVDTSPAKLFFVVNIFSHLISRIISERKVRNRIKERGTDEIMLQNRNERRITRSEGKRKNKRQKKRQKRPKRPKKKEKRKGKRKKEKGERRKETGKRKESRKTKNKRYKNYQGLVKKLQEYHHKR